MCLRGLLLNGGGVVAWFGVGLIGLGNSLVGGLVSRLVGGVVVVGESTRCLLPPLLVM